MKANRFSVLLELLKDGNSFLRRWVSGEEGIHEGEQTMLHLIGLADEQLCNVGALHVVESRICRYLAQRRSQGQRVSAEFCSAMYSRLRLMAKRVSRVKI